MLIETLKSIVGERGWTDDPTDLEPHLTEWRGSYRGKTALMVMPDSTAAVAAVVKACNEANTAIVVQGGNTGLCGGAIPDSTGNQVLLSLARLNRIRSVSPNDFSLVAEAGCILADVQSAAEEANRFFALSLAAEGSCFIGGNLSTNAGGTNVLRYGTARDQVLGLEVVLPSGEIWNGLRTLRKDTAGYDVKQLFIGAEGTLGVITAASLKLFPPPVNRQVAMLAVPDAQSAVDLFAELRGELADQMQAFELISARALRMVLRAFTDARSPFAGESGYDWLVLLDSAAPAAGRSVEEALVALMESGLVVDAVVAKNSDEQGQFWHLRHAISEAQKRDGASLKHDVSVPVGDVGRFIEKAEQAVTATVPDSRLVAFGHVGDGNVHFNVSQPTAMAAEQFLALREDVARVVYDVVEEFAGSISAEHGVGVLKRQQLTRYRSATEVGIMRTVKNALDPKNLFNPGKVIDP